MAAGATVLRLYDLDRDELWFDEAFAALTAMQPVSGLLGELARDTSPPLYFLFLRGWALIVGFDPWWLRVPSVAFGALAVVVVTILGTRLWSGAAGAAAGIFLAVSPLHVYYSREVRPYALLVVVVLLSSLTLHASGLRRRRMLALYVALTLAAMYTHNYGLFLLVLLATAAAVGRVAARAALTAALTLIVAYAPWAPVLLQQMRSGATAWLYDLWLGTPPPLAIVKSLAAFCVGGSVPVYVPLGAERVPSLLQWAAYGAFALLVLRALARRDRSTVDVAAALVLLLGVPFALSFFSPVYLVARHDIMALPFFLLLAARGLVELDRTKALAVSVLVAGLAVVANRAYFTRPPIETGRRQASLLLEHARERDAVVGTGFTRNTVEFYVRLNGGRQMFSSFPLSFDAHRGWVDHRELRTEQALQRDAARLSHLLRDRLGKEGRLWIVHSRDLADANERLMHQIVTAFRQVPCPADGERLGLTCWKTRGPRP